MPEKHPNTERIGGPGASHENRKQPEKSQEHVGILRTAKWVQAEQRHDTELHQKKE
jgi:hypothetical protein